MNLVIETRQLSRHFGNVAALDKIDIRIRQGEFVAIMGASGSGKTTLMNILTCMDTLSSGQLLLDNEDVSAFDEDQRRQFRADKMGLVFQQFHLIPYLSALENVMLAQHYHSVVDLAAAQQVLTQVGLAHRFDHLPSQLSGGVQQSVCIARALVTSPEILFAVEPSGNLDEQYEQLVLALLRQVHAEGRTIVMVTHNPELGKVADRVIRLQHGKLVENTTDDMVAV